MSKEGNDEWPVLAYYYEVEIDGERVSFQEVSGLKATLDVEEVQEGGNNGFVHRLPVRIKYSNLTMSRGISEEGADELVNWLEECLEEPVSNSFGDKRKDLQVRLLSPGGEIVRSWDVIMAFPVEWSGPELHALENRIAMEQVIFSFETLRQS